MGNAQCPKRRGDYPSPPTLGMEFPVAFDEYLTNHERQLSGKSIPVPAQELFHVR
ncbi:MAG: hypothetical protein V7L04_21465 [Nostoc sp.]